MRILIVGEFSQIATGYGKITSELIQRFYKDGYEVAELATFCDANNPKIAKCPWKVYPNFPSTQEESDIYFQNPQNANGKWKFEQVLLDFMPTHVFGNGDPFFYEYQMWSPFRKYFNWIITAPIDGMPQHNQWIQIFNDADGLTTYTNWGKTVLEDYGIKVDGVTPPIASDEFFPISLEEIDKFKKFVGISDKKIIGTVMRNQPRKLFNELFSAFSKYLKNNKDTVLYCHTTYPDGGWDLPELLLKYDIFSNVLFTYKCKLCNQAYPNFFQDLKTTCPFCKQISSTMPNGQDSVDNKTLNKIINIFDVYIQLASREGFGIPQIEAAACDIPVITMKYAGMSDMGDSINAKFVDVNNYYFSYPMNMLEGVPDEQSVLNALEEVVKSASKTGKHRNKYQDSYGSWDKTYKVFKDIVDNLPAKTWEKKEILTPPQYSDLQISNEDYVKFLILYVLNDPSLLGSYLSTRLIKDLNSGITFGGICGNYLTESIEQKHYQEFNRQKAYEIMMHNRKFRDYWQFRLNEKLNGN